MVGVTGGWGRHFFSSLFSNFKLLGSFLVGSRKSQVQTGISNLLVVPEAGGRGPGSQNKPTGAVYVGSTHPALF